MEMERFKSVKVMEVCKVSPSSAEDKLSLPLTFFDLIFVHLPPMEYLFFYSLSDADPPFMTSILPKLKHSLSRILSYFLPLAGNVTWPDDSPEPYILYKPGDVVALIIAETELQFSRLSANYIQNATESHALIPELEPTGDSVSPAMSLQITLFPNSGFSIGVKMNHVVADGTTMTMFLKSWARICKLNLHTLPLELTPFFDRAAIKDPTGIDVHYRKNLSWATPSSSDPEVKSLGLPSEAPISQDIARCIFELSHADIEHLRKKVANSETRYLSSFSLTYAYVSTSMIKAQRTEGKSNIALTLPVDWRPRSKLLVPANYFGNGVSILLVVVETREFEEEDRLSIIANKISDAIAELAEKMKNKTVAEILDEGLSKLKREIPNTSKIIAVSGSPKFGVYETDFGWGSCKKVEITSIAPGETISLAESRNGDGGVEVGIALPRDTMDVFASIFSDGLKRS